MNAAIEDSMREMVIPLLEPYNAFLVDIAVRGERNTRIVEVFIDTEKGIDAKQLGAINRELNRQLQEGDIIHGSYRVSVSSPGLDRPLKTARQYRKNIGRELEVHVTEDNRDRTITGSLDDADEDGFRLRLKDGSVQTFSYDEIRKTFIKLPW
jgi:ribosome maturation factor RimP